MDDQAESLKTEIAQAGGRGAVATLEHYPEVLVWYWRTLKACCEGRRCVPDDFFQQYPPGGTPPALTKARFEMSDYLRSFVYYCGRTCEHRKYSLTPLDDTWKPLSDVDAGVLLHCAPSTFVHARRRRRRRLANL